MEATMEEVDKNDVEATIDEPMPKRPRHAAPASSLGKQQQLSPLAQDLARAVRALVEADRRADDAEEQEDEEEEQGGDASIDDGSKNKKKKKTSSAAATAPPPPPPRQELLAATSSLDKLLKALSQARKAGQTVPSEMEKALDEWREGVEVRFVLFFQLFLLLRKKTPLFSLSPRFLSFFLISSGLLLPPPGPPRRLPRAPEEAPEPEEEPQRRRRRRRRKISFGCRRRRRRLAPGPKAGLHLPRPAVWLGPRAALASRWGQASGAAGVADQGLGAAEALR